MTRDTIASLKKEKKELIIENKKLKDKNKKLESENKKLKEKEDKSKKKKDINAPKRYKSAYIFFYVEKFNEYKNKYPNKSIKITEIHKELGLSQEWKDIKEDKTKYKKYKEMEDNDKKEYENKIELYKRNIEN